MKAHIALTHFQTIEPPLVMEQSEVLKFTTEVHAASQQRQGLDSSRLATLVKRYGVKPAQISKRAFENIQISGSGASIRERAEFFGQRGREIMNQFYKDASRAPDHIVHVTCTGYISPSPAQHLVNDKKWTTTTAVTHAYHMGCYASLPAIRMAEGFVAAAPTHIVDVVHTEMCGLHLDRNDHSPEQLVVQSLFADGHIKYSAVAASTATLGFKILKICEQILPYSQTDMSWLPDAGGMRMTLSREVPEKISKNLRGFVLRLLQDTGHDLSEILKTAIFAIHPGGPKIIDSVVETLELNEDQVQTSKEILFNRGNMSSATLPHVWQKLLDNKIESKQLVVSLAFGPGLTIFGALFESI